MTIKINLVVLAVLLCVCVTSYFIFMSLRWDVPPGTIYGLFGIAIGFGSLLVSIINVKRTSESQRDRELKNAAINALERAYEVFTNGDDSKVPPTPSRYGWLTTARRIVVFQKLVKQIKSEEYRLVCREEEEHWRHKFYKMIKIPMNNNASYFECKGNDTDSESFMTKNLEPSSIAIIYSFAHWKSGKEDDLDSIDFNKLLKKENAFNGEYGLQLYFQSNKECQAFLAKHSPEDGALTK